MRLLEKSKLFVFTLFFLSGATGLVYEVAWTRKFTVVFGNTVHAASTVLAAYMGGLALGSLLLGRRGDRFRKPVVVYGVLEVAVAIYALIMPALIGHLTGLYSIVFQAVGQRPLSVTILRFLLSFIVLLVPTTLMGGTLPILAKFAGREFRKIGGNVGALYAFNTFGAVVGSFLTGFILLEALGVSSSVYLAAGVGAAVGLAAIWAGRRSEFSIEAPEVESTKQQAISAEPSAPPRPASGSRGCRVPELPKTPSMHGLLAGQGGDRLPRYVATVVLVSYAISGAAALGYEVLYTKVLIFSLGLSAHAFSVMLTTFLMGLALGSAISSKLVDRARRPIETLAMIEVLIGAAVFVSIYLLRDLDLTHHSLAIKDAGGNLFRLRGADFLESAMVMFGPTLLMGAAFPVAARIYTRKGHVSSSVGRIYSFNTVGGVAGSLIAGFVLVPSIGSARSIALLASINIAVGILLFSCVGRRRFWVTAAAAMFTALVVATHLISPAIFVKTFSIRQPGSELLYFKEGVSGTVTVHRYPEYDLLAIDGVDVAGTNFMLRVTQKLQAHLPVLLAADTRRIAHIGFGSGETLHVLNLHQVGTIDGIEICKDVISTARRFFAPLNLNAFDRRNVRIIIMDGKNYILLTRNKYDIIMTDSIYPGSGGASALYTYDHFKEVRERLNPGGVASCWLPLDISKPDLQAALKAFCDVFPDMTVWYFYMDFSQHALLVGRKDAPIRIDLANFAGVFADSTLKADLASILIDEPFTLISCLLADGDAVRRFCGASPRNTDDHPVLEFGIARRGTAKAYLSGNLEEMMALRPNPLAYVINARAAGMDSAYVTDQVLKYMNLSANIIAGHICSAIGETGKAEALYEKALAIDPGNRIALKSISEIDKARDMLERAAAVGTEDYSAIYRLGVRYLAEGKFEQALPKLEKALELRPDLPDPHVSLGEYYLRSGKADKALECFIGADKVKPGDAGILLRIGICYDQLGKGSEAKNAYLRSVQIDPASYEARNNLGNLYLGEGDIASARKQFESAVKTAPAKPEAIYNLGLTFAREGNWTQAINYYKQSLKLAPTFYPAYFSLGDALYALGDRQGAVAAWQRTLELKPDHAGARQRLLANHP